MRELAPGVYGIGGKKGGRVRAFLLDAGRELTLIDTLFESDGGLVARAIERIGDNAVDIGEQTAFVVTGLFREFTDASHPEVDAPPALS